MTIVASETSATSSKKERRSLRQFFVKYFLEGGFSTFNSSIETGQTRSQSAARIEELPEDADFLERIVARNKRAVGE